MPAAEFRCNSVPVAMSIEVNCNKTLSAREFAAAFRSVPKLDEPKIGEDSAFHFASTIKSEFEADQNRTGNPRCRRASQFENQWLGDPLGTAVLDRLARRMLGVFIAPAPQRLDRMRRTLKQVWRAI